jgi:hypothetical protein
MLSTAPIATVLLVAVQFEHSAYRYCIILLLFYYGLDPPSGWPYMLSTTHIATVFYCYYIATTFEPPSSMCASSH